MEFKEMKTLFQENFKKFAGEVTEDIASAGPTLDK